MQQKCHRCLTKYEKVDSTGTLLVYICRVNSLNLGWVIDYGLDFCGLPQSLQVNMMTPQIRQLLLSRAIPTHYSVSSEHTVSATHSIITYTIKE